MAVLLYGKPLFSSGGSEEGCRRGFKPLSDAVTHLGTLQLPVFAAARDSLCKASEHLLVSWHRGTIWFLNGEAELKHMAVLAAWITFLHKCPESLHSFFTFPAELLTGSLGIRVRVLSKSVWHVLPSLTASCYKSALGVILLSPTVIPFLCGQFWGFHSVVFQSLVLRIP